jgi:dolichol-phosphate mannosyltransferase
VAYSVLAWRRLEDLGSGLNVFRLDDLDPRTYLGFGNSLTFNYELILDLVRRRVHFGYVPITWREEDQVTNARNWKIFRTALGILLRWRIGLTATTVPAGAAYEWDEVGR